MVHIASTGSHRPSAMETQCGGCGVLQTCGVVCSDRRTTAKKVCAIRRIIARFPSRGHRTFPMSEHIFCDCHETNFNLVFCNTCEKMCCPVSAIQEHKEHECYPLESKTDSLRQNSQDFINSMGHSTEENQTLENIHALLKNPRSCTQISR